MAGDDASVACSSSPRRRGATSAPRPAFVAGRAAPAAVTLNWWRLRRIPHTQTCTTFRDPHAKGAARESEGRARCASPATTRRWDPPAPIRCRQRTRWRTSHTNGRHHDVQHRSPRPDEPVARAAVLALRPRTAQLPALLRHVRLWPSRNARRSGALAVARHRHRRCGLSTRALESAGRVDVEAALPPTARNPRNRAVFVFGAFPGISFVRCPAPSLPTHNRCPAFQARFRASRHGFDKRRETSLSTTRE